ncbi:hypothetical protein GGS26DRAFT_592254 [Hypomontagnella submonticulosa]|nr:hypothetical protein GGS26DRAFT_592254 [Hypomontagnella submonticulosa]
MSDQLDNAIALLLLGASASARQATYTDAGTQTGPFGEGGVAKVAEAEADPESEHEPEEGANQAPPQAVVQILQPAAQAPQPATQAPQQVPQAAIQASQAANQAPPPGVQAQQAPVAHPTAVGHVDAAGRFVCFCGSTMRNRLKNIGSHLSSRHNPNSAYSLKRANNPRVCGSCTRTVSSFHQFEAHIRNVHGRRGGTAVLWNEWRNTTPDTVIDPFMV